VSCRLVRFNLIQAVLGAVLALATPTLVFAHPLGNFTVNHYSRIEPAGDSVRVVYVLDMAEIPAFQEQARIDADRDGQVTDPERDRYAEARVDEIRRNLHLAFDDAPQELRLVRQSLSFPPGQGGLSTLRLEATFEASLPTGAGRVVGLTYRDDNNPGRLGWREIVARPGTPDTTIQQATVPTDDRTDELRSYPEDLLSSPLDVRQARVTFIPGAAGAVEGARIGSGSGLAARGTDVYAALAAAEDLTPTVILVSLGTALILGAIHALSPGHGKTVVAAYLVGSRGTAQHALFLGATVTATHTAGVYALGFVTLFLSEYILPERLYPFLEVVSGLLVVGIGGWLFATRLSRVLPRFMTSMPQRPEDDALAQQPAHSHSHIHDEQTPTANVAAVSQAHGHSHSDMDRKVPAQADVYSLAYAEAQARAHDRAHRHPHDREHPFADTEVHEHGHGRDHSHGQGVQTHTHGGSTHSHLPPGADGQPVTWRSLLALGVSGGLLPCPSALVVLLSAIALHRVGFGLLLIVAFSLGLASVLVGIGLLLVYARGILERFSVGGGVATRVLPIVSAFLIMLAGLVITLQALPRVL